MKRLSTIFAPIIAPIFALALFPVMTFGQSICNSSATGSQPYSLTGSAQPQSAVLPLLGYFATGDVYVALLGMPMSPTSFCGPLWEMSNPYVVGNMIEPLPLGAVFQAVTNPGCSSNCKSGSTQPPGFGGTLILPSNIYAVITTCSDTGTTATCTMVSPLGDPSPLNLGEPYQGAVVGSTVVIQNYSNPAYNGSWVVTASTNPPGPPFASPFTFSFTASGLGSGNCTDSKMGTVCTAYQQGTQITDGGILWQYAGPQDEIGPTVVVTPAAFSITTAEALDVTVAVGGGGGKGPPTGTVTLTSGSYLSAATALITNHAVTSATINIPAGSLPAGMDALTGTYSGDGNYGTATGINSVTVTQSGLLTPTVMVTPAASSITTAQALNVTIAISGGSGNPTPTGRVTMTSGSYSSGATTLSNGSATITIPAGSLAVGTDTLTASYPGDSNYSAATGTASVTVTKLTPTVTVTPSASSITTMQALNVTVAVSGGSGNPTPTGTVTLTSGSYNSGATTLSNGSATITIPAGSLAVGMDTLTASYSGDSNYTTATGTASVTVTPVPGFTLSAGTASPPSVSPGGSSTATVTVTPGNGYSGSITLSCSISPVVSGTSAPTCSLSPNPVVTSNGLTSTLTFTSVGPSPASQRSLSRTRKGMAKAGANPDSTTRTSGMKFQSLALWLPISGLALAGLVFGSSATQRKKMRSLGLICLVSTALVLLPSCGSNSSGSRGTPPAGYTVTITGKDANGVTQSGAAATVTVTVN